MKQTELAIRLGITPKHLTNIIGGKVAITTDTAHALQAVFGQPAEYWLSLQTNYDLTRLRLHHEKNYQLDKSMYDEWLSKFDYRNLVKQGFIINDQPDNHPMVKIRNLLDFFGCSDISSWNRMYNSELPAACRVAGAVSIKTGNALAWLRYGQIHALKNITNLPPYDKAAFRAALLSIRALTNHKGEYLKPMREACQKAGVCLMFLPEIPGTGLCGAAFWVGNKSNPCILMSHRFKKNDHFWFTFFHEAAHIIREHKKVIFFDGNDRSTSQAENEADKMAGDILIPTVRINRFIANADFSEKSIRKFADSLGIHPGIVVGRLQHDQIIPWSWHNRLKEAINVF